MANRLYAEPRIYDLAFSYRDYERQVSELTDWHRAASPSGRPPESVLELACGPGRHLLEFARAGIPGRGIDTSQPMCAYANALAEAEQLDVRAQLGDMTAFELRTTFDLVLLMLNSLSHILDEPSLHSHFISVADHLNDQGIYVIEADPASTEWPEAHAWSAADQTASVSVRWGFEAGFERARIVGSVDGTQVDVHDRFPMRGWSTADLMLIGRNAGLSVVGRCGEFAADLEGALAQTTTFTSSSGLHPCLAFTRSPRR